MQGWVIEFYDSRLMNGASVISVALDICKNLNLTEGKKLVVIFVGFSIDGKHHVSSNNADLQFSLIQALSDSGIDAGATLESYRTKPVLPCQGQGWGSFNTPSASVEEVFRDRADFANRIIRMGGMEECGRALQYVNLSFTGKQNIAQIHPQENGIAIVLRSIKDNRPMTSFAEIPVTFLTGYKGSNATWLAGAGQFKEKGPAVAFLIPNEVDELGDDSKEWQEILKLLDYAKTLA